MTYIEADPAGAYEVGRQVHGQGGPIRAAMSSLLASYDQAGGYVADETLANALYEYRDRYQREHLQVADEAENLGINTILGAIGIDDAQHESANAHATSLGFVESFRDLVSPPPSAG